MSEIRIGCVGAGRWGKNLVRNYAALESLEVICEADADRRSALIEEYPRVRVTASFDELLNDPSLHGICIATPAECHEAMARRALLAGKDVFVEKPLSLSMDEARDLVRIASERARILMVGHLLWYHPAILKLKDLINEGVLGRIQYIYSNRLNLGQIRREENILWSFAPHDVSVILGLVNEMPDFVEAHGGNYLHQEIADVTVTSLSFPSGVQGHIFVSWLHPFKEQKLVVVGDRQMAVFDDVKCEDKLTLYPHSIEWRNGLPIAEKADAHSVPIESTEPLRAECQQFIDSVGTRVPPRTDGSEALKVLEVLHTCQKRLEATPHRITPHRGLVERANQSPPSVTMGAHIHESAYIDEDVEIGDGTTVWHFSHVLSGSRIGRSCRIGQNVVIGPKVTIGDGVKIQNNVSVYQGVTLEDDVFCGPSMVFTNVYNPRSEIGRMDDLRPTNVRKGASLGANCTIVCGVEIGSYAFVGAGAVVLTDVPDHALIVGNPGRAVGHMCRCGERIYFPDGKTGACLVCETTYLRSGDRVNIVDGTCR